LTFASFLSFFNNNSNAQVRHSIKSLRCEKGLTRLRLLPPVVCVLCLIIVVIGEKVFG